MDIFTVWGRAAEKEKFPSAASLLSSGLNVHWATGLLLKDSDPGPQLLMHLL